MTKEEIINGNILIAEFMGSPPYMSKSGIHVGRHVVLIQNEERLIYSLKYNYYWDWLMPVVEKIEKLGNHFRINSYNSGEKNHCNFFKGLSDVPNKNIPNQSKIDSVYNAVVDFIENYNKQTPTPFKEGR